MNTKQKKANQLEMNPATAAGRLRKKIMFALIKAAELDNCYRCGERIETIEELSVEHKIPWLDSDDPVRLYFDLNNIAFSHLRCNSGDHKGVKNGRNKLREEEVYLLRYLYNTGRIKQKVLAKMFNIHEGHVSNIITGRLWKK